MNNSRSKNAKTKYGNIPRSLKEMDQWVLWRYEARDGGKLAKVPYRADGGRADITDPSSFMPLKEAKELKRRNGFDGIGFVTTEEDNIVGIDIDDCVKNGKISDFAQNIIDAFDCYSEFSPSGNGVRIFVQGKLPDIEKYLRKNSKLQLEMYDANRYFTVTGNTINKEKIAIKQKQNAINKICEKHMKRNETGDSGLNKEALSLNDEEVLRKCGSDKKFNRLFSGDWKNSYGSQSDADLALCGILARNSRNEEQIERLFSQSKLGKRDKWRQRSDYRSRTIKKAMEGLSAPDGSGQDEESRESFFCEYDSKKKKWVVNQMRFLEWIQEQGIMLIKRGDAHLFVYAPGNIVAEIDEEGLKMLVMKILRKKGHYHEVEAVHNTSSRLFSKWSLNTLPASELDFLEDTEESAYFFFRSSFVEITAEGYELHRYGQLKKMGKHIWKTQKIIRDFHDYVEGMGEFEIFVRNTASFSTPLNKNSKRKPNEHGYYFSNPRYNVSRSAIGEKAHSYKNPKEAVVTVFVDADMDDVSQGGTGKSLIAGAFKHIKNTVVLEGKNINFNNRFAMQNVSHDTALIVFDDANKYFKVERLFPLITGDFSFEKKGRQRVIMAFETSPKMIITSNHPILGYGHSFERRQHIVELSDFYRKVDVEEAHSGKLFSEDWDKYEWSRFFKFIIECVRFYLRRGLKKTVSASYLESKLKSECSPGFVDWADGFFELEETYELKEAHKNFLGLMKIEEADFSQYKFTSTLKSYARGRGLEVNPGKTGNRDRRDGVDYITLEKIRAES